MPNGKKMEIGKATDNIHAFRLEVEQVSAQLNLPPKELAIGQKFDLQLVKDFMTAIQRHNDDPTKELDIDSIRIYLAKSHREGDEYYDVVIVPVLTNDKDLHKVYPKEGFVDELETLLGEGLPCPNVCPDKAFFC
jgi:hypothetical protein